MQLRRIVLKITCCCVSGSIRSVGGANERRVAVITLPLNQLWRR
jgi:hypothetical protein